MISNIHVGKVLLLFGILVALAGVLFLLSDKVPFIGKLPGDIVIKRDNFTFYFPITTSLIVSIILTLLIKLFTKH